MKKVLYPRSLNGTITSFFQLQLDFEAAWITVQIQIRWLWQDGFVKAIWSGFTLFSKEDLLRFSRAWLNNVGLIIFVLKGLHTKNNIVGSHF